MEKLPIASDHAGFELKQEIIEYLSTKFQVEDFGCYSCESIDYPDFGFSLAEAVASGKFFRGILLCGSGIGMSIVANKVKGIRAALCHRPEFAALSRQHNNSNILVLSARFLSIEQAKEIIDVWLNTEFEGGRHQKRLDKITAYENKV